MSPIVEGHGKVLVTGANGYLATWICRTLLEQGYSVKGAVRSASKGDYLKTLFEKHGDAFQYIIVGDMAKEGAFDEHVKDVQAVLHTAAKGPVNATSLSELISTNVDGTLAVLNSVLAHGSTVRRFIYTSSTAVVVDKPGEVITEETVQWNDFIVDQAQTNPNAPGIFLYLASKVLAEKAAWAWVEQHKSEMKFDFVSLIVPWIIGPQIQEVHTKSDLTEVIGILYTGLTTEWPSSERYKHFSAWADIRDISLAHVRAMEKEAAANQRFFISAGSFALQDIYDVLNEKPEAVFKGVQVPKGDPNLPKGPYSMLSTEKAERVLGVTFRPLKESITEAFVSHQELLSRVGA